MGGHQSLAMNNSEAIFEALDMDYDSVILLLGYRSPAINNGGGINKKIKLRPCSRDTGRKLPLL